MRILLDNCVHKGVAAFFPGHAVKTAYQAGLAQLENGALMVEASKNFDVLITTDKNIRHQHDLSNLPLSVIELTAIDTRIEGLMPLAPFCPAAMEQCSKYRFVSVRSDGSLELKAERA